MVVPQNKTTKQNIESRDSDTCTLMFIAAFFINGRGGNNASVDNR